MMDEQPVTAAPKRKNIMMLGALVGVMLVEAVGVFIFVKHFSKSANPQSAEAAGHGLVANEGKKQMPELEVRIGEFRGQNHKGQQSYTVSFDVFAAVPASSRGEAMSEKGSKDGDDKSAMMRAEDAAVAANAAKIKDRFTRVIRSMDPEVFAEPDLMTLRGKLKEALDEVLGTEVKISEVLLTDFSFAVDS